MSAALASTLSTACLLGGLAWATGVRRIKQERLEQNRVAPCLTRRRTPPWARLADRIRELIRHQPDPTLRELNAEL